MRTKVPGAWCRVSSAHKPPDAYEESFNHGPSRLFNVVCRICLALQRTQKGDQIGPFTGRQTKRTNRRIQIGSGTAALVVELDDRLERGEAAIVHMRRGEADIPGGSAS